MVSGGVDGLAILTANEPISLDYVGRIGNPSYILSVNVGISLDELETLSCAGRIGNPSYILTANVRISLDELETLS